MGQGEERQRRIPRSISMSASLLFSAAGIGSIGVGCADNESSIFVRGVLAPPAAAAGGQCVYTPDPSQPQVMQPTLDVGFRGTYLGAVLVGNHLVTRQDRDQARTETSRVQFQGATVSVIDARSGATISSFTTLATGFADPAQGNQPGYGTVLLTLVNEDATRSLGEVGAEGAKLISRFRVFGKTLGGVEVESNEYQLPIDVCVGCLVTFPADSEDKALAASEGKPNCRAASAGSTVAQPCAVGQDVPIDCRLCQGNPLCDPAR